MITIGGEQGIYLPKTKEYFKEVVLDYEVGNYRSAIVMLYTLVIYDLINKVRELSDIYSDSRAQKLLKEIESERKKEFGSRSSWEKSFIDKVYNVLKLIDDRTYGAINHLYDYRNLSAHPALNDDYELLSVSKEMTMAYIREMLEQVFIKSPIITDKVIDMLTEDVKKIYPLYIEDLGGMKEYLDRKYFSNMPDYAKQKCFKAFWKFCFLINDNEECINNRLANRRVLEILSSETADIATYFKKEKFFESLPESEDAILHLMLFTARCPHFYNLYTDALRRMVDNHGNKPQYKAIAWFNKPNKIEHLESIINEDDIKVSKGEAKYIKSQYDKEGLKNEYLKFCINMFAKSGCYNDADDNYVVFIKENLKEFSRQQLLLLFDAINENDQIYGRGMAKDSNTEIVQEYYSRVGNTDILDEYPNIIYNLSKIGGVEEEFTKG